jgi:hypothetical protein
MKIDYVKKISKGYYSGYGYEIKDIELCCENMKHDLKNNLINMSKWNPYHNNDYYLGLIDGRNTQNTRIINFCPHCGKPVLLNRLEDEIHNGLEYYDAEATRNVWDEFYPYDFDKDQRFYK